MDHEPVLISTIAIGLVAAFIGGLIAQRLRLPTIVGYIAAGVALGPFTPGIIADTQVAGELAEIGVILLMFGVGMHFSVRDLLAVRSVAVPGGIGQAAVATGVGYAVGRAWGWPGGESLVFGLALSVASTVVLLRALSNRGRLEEEAGRIAVGWLLVEDVLMVLALVLLPTLAEPLGGVAGTAGSSSVALTVVVTLAKLVGFVALMLVAGTRVIPRMLAAVDRTRSRELFLLAVLAVALGIAFGAAELFDVSVALGAFLAGVVVGGSEHRSRAEELSQPLQDMFTVLFFVSIGMLIDPAFLLRNLDRVAVVALLVIVVKSIIALGIVRVLGRPSHVGWTVAVGLAQVGEFSFILVELGRGLGLLSEEAQSLVLAGALVSITVNPFLFRLLDRRSSGATRAT